MTFAECMRDNGVREFPDPDASGEVTIDANGNGSSVDPSSAAWKRAIAACKDPQPPGFTGHKRSAQEQGKALEFAQCMRDNGVPDFADPDPDGPIIDIDGSQPGLKAAGHHLTASSAIGGTTARWSQRPHLPRTRRCAVVALAHPRTSSTDGQALAPRRGSSSA